MKEKKKGEKKRTVSHSISYTVPHSYFVSSNSIFRPSQAKTSLTFLKPPKHLSPLTSNLLGSHDLDNVAVSEVKNQYGDLYSAGQLKTKWAKL